MKRSAFTMVELIFVIVIIGVLASIAIPKLSGVSDGAKKTAEIATISAVSTAIETAHGEWSINESEFKWGMGMTYSSTNKTLNDVGYPTDLNKTVYNINTNNQPFDAILKGDNSQFKRVKSPVTINNKCTFSIFTGPASDSTLGVKFDTKATNNDIPSKPDKNDFWIYASEVNSTNATYTNDDGSVTTFLSGDILLIDVRGTNPSNYAAVVLTCN